MLKILRKSKYILTLFIFLICISLCIYLKIKLNNNKDSIQENEIVKQEEIKEEKIDTIDECTIDVKGAVNAPGVYTILCSNTVNDAINIAGGTTELADTSVVNLAKKISNEMVIIVYTKEEVANSNVVNTVIKTIENECVCPNIENDACINTEIIDEIGSNKLININTASASELQTIPGIGASKAKAIIAYRERNNGFNSIEELLNVDGIGEKLYEEIKVYITT